MIDGRSNIRTEHAHKVEDDACCGPAIATREAEIKEDSTKGHAQEDATSMAPGVPQLFFMIIEYLYFHDMLLLTDK